MKNLLLVLCLLSPFTARAATSLVCDSEGSAGALVVTITSAEGLDRPQAHVTINAKGILNTTFLAVVDKIVACDETRVSSDLTTLAAAGVINQDSGQVTLTVARQGGTGSIDITKMPKVNRPLRLLSHYDLTNCKGSL